MPKDCEITVSHLPKKSSNIFGQCNGCTRYVTSDGFIPHELFALRVRRGNRATTLSLCPICFGNLRKIVDAVKMEELEDVQSKQEA